MFIGYDMFRNLAKCKAKNCRKKTREDLAKCLLDPGKLKTVCVVLVIFGDVDPCMVPACDYTCVVSFSRC